MREHCKPNKSYLLKILCACLFVLFLMHSSCTETPFPPSLSRPIQTDIIFVNTTTDTLLLSIDYINIVAPSVYHIPPFDSTQIGTFSAESTLVDPSSVIAGISFSTFDKNGRLIDQRIISTVRNSDFDCSGDSTRGKISFYFLITMATTEYYFVNISSDSIVLNYMCRDSGVFVNTPVNHSDTLLLAQTAGLTGLKQPSLLFSSFKIYQFDMYGNPRGSMITTDADWDTLYDQNSSALILTYNNQ
jgi:hypothetical protein